MAEDYYSSRSLRSGSSLKGLLLAVLLSFAGGAALVGYLVWNGQIELGQAAATPAPPAVAAPSPAPAPLPSAQPPAVLGQQIADLEQRLARLNLQAAAFDGSAVRAEGLLVAQAARRAIDQGQPLDYLEPQLQTRFGAARPDAVRTILAAAKAPLTRDSLAAELDVLGPALLGRPADETGWQSFSRTVRSLFVVRRDDGTARPAANRLDHARLLLASGQIAQAVAEVERLPGAAAARAWSERARRYAATQAALAQIEQAALTEPQLLKTGDGEAVNQPGLDAPAVAPAPGRDAAPR